MTRVEPTRARTDKRLKHQGVHKKSFLLAILAERHITIPISMGTKNKILTAQRISEAITTNDDSINTADIPEVRDLVQPFIPDYGAPGFNLNKHVTVLLGWMGQHPTFKRLCVLLGVYFD